METNQIICGDCLEVLKTLPAESVSCCISSPPYWALRDYGVDGQLGLEKTFEEYIDKLCTIYDQVKRVLRKDGTCWVNLGDTYGGANSRASSGGRAGYGTPREGVYTRGLEKSLCLIPERFAIEMVNRGWILRNVVIWHKPNPMPSSAKDRFTVDFEDVFFFTKSNKANLWLNDRKGRMVNKRPSPDYIWIHKPTGTETDYQPFSDRICKGKKRLWQRRNLWEGQDYFFEPQYEEHESNNRTGRIIDGELSNKRYSEAKDNGVSTGSRMGNNPLGRNKRTVWTIPTQPFPEAHFATYPEKLVEPMIEAGCPKYVCTKCGTPRKKVYEGTSNQAFNIRVRDVQKDRIKHTDRTATKAEVENYKEGETHAGEGKHFKGYSDCPCRFESQNEDAGTGGKWRPGIVLDPFAAAAQRFARPLN